MAEKTTYFVKRNITVSGPFSLAQLKAAILNKKLNASYSLSNSADGPWTELKTVYKQIVAGQPPQLDDPDELELGGLEILNPENALSPIDPFDSTGTQISDATLPPLGGKSFDSPVGSYGNPSSPSTLSPTPVRKKAKRPANPPSTKNNKLVLGLAIGGAGLFALFSIAIIGGYLLFSGGLGSSNFNSDDLSATFRWVRSLKETTELANGTPSLRQKLEGYSGQTLQWELSPFSASSESAELFRFANIGSRGDPILLVVRAKIRRGGDADDDGNLLNDFPDNLARSSSTDSYLVTGSIEGVELFYSKTDFMETHEARESALFDGPAG